MTEVAGSKGAPPGGDWAAYRLLVLSELERINTSLSEIARKEDQVRARIGQLEENLRQDHAGLERRVLVIETNARAAGKAAGRAGPICHQ